MFRKTWLYNNLIVIDIANIKGVAYNLNFANSRVVYVKPYDTDDLGAAFDFDPELNKKRMQLGYLDTKKAFGELSGNIYHFLPQVFRQIVWKHGADEIYELELLAHKLGVAKDVIYSEETFISAVKLAYETAIAELEEKDEGKSKSAEVELTDEISAPEQEKSEDTGIFNLAQLRSYFTAQKKTGFEDYEKAVAIIESI